MISRRMFPARFAAAVAGLTLGLAVACTAPPVEAPKPQPITIATFSKALGNSPYYIARHFKWFEADSNLKDVAISYKEYNDRPTISAAFDSGELQVLFSADVPSILCRAQGNDIRIAAISATVGQNILVRSDLPYKEVPDLKGKTLAIQQGTSSYYGLLKILKTYNLEEKDLAIKYMPAAEAKAAFETNQIEAWAVWAPFVEQQEVSGKGRLVLGGDAMVNSVVSLSQRFIEQREPAARGVIAAIQRAKAWIQANPDEAQKIMAQELGLDLAVVKQAWPKHDWGVQLNEKLIADIQDKATFLADEDKTRASKKLDVRRELVDTRFPQSGT